MNKNITKMVIVVTMALGLTACSADKGTKEYNQGVAAMKTGDYEKAYELIGTAIGKNTEEPLYYINYGTVLVQLKRYDEAVNSYKKAISTGTEETNIENNKRAYRGLGITYYYQEKYSDAEAYLQKALDINKLPNLNMDAYLYLGAVQEAKNDMEGALKTYGSALALDDTKISAYVGKYKAEVALGAYEEAEDTLEKGLEQTANTAEDKYMFARLQFYHGDYAEAEPVMQEAKEVYPESYLYLGQIMMQKQAYAEAITNFEAFAKQTDGEKTFLLCKQLAKCYMKEKQYEQASVWLDEAVEFNVSEVELQDACYDRVVAYEKLKKPEKALKMAREYSEMYVNDDRFANKVKELEAVAPATAEATN